MRVPRPFLLAVLDGWGESDENEGNAIKLADTTVMDGFFRDYPSTQILASGRAVGLPPGQMGNSEVGHLNIGAGRVVMQDLERINCSIETGEFYENQVLSVIEEVTRAYLAVHEAEEAIYTAETALRQARENLDMAEGRYRAGVSDSIELSDAQVLYTESKSSLVQAVYEHHKALAGLEFAVGGLLGV